MKNFFHKIADKERLEKYATIFLKYFTVFTFILLGLFLYFKDSPPAVLATWDQVKNLQPQEEARNSKGEKFIFIPETGGNNLNNSLERMINMKNAMKSPIDDYGVINMYLVSRELNINPAIPFCIGVADSQLGKSGRANRTKNVGNIAHYDKGGLRFYKTFKDGFEAIPRLLTRDQYRNTDKIGLLSNGGRILLGFMPDCGVWSYGDKCWATSQENHYINVVRCVREIEDDMSIDYNFNFRI
jgi:hypothetical protein